ncbi:uncharacterized protein LOC141588511 [Silene latifolia]|uniref:uncharacterized protein LOC141588511 n=1 Tax=Silene latifolia TaxID=37657 RepID=UPI003D76FBD2
MKGGSGLQWQMNNFRDAVDDCELRDVRFEGYPFTFDNGQVEGANRQCRLDRAMSTGEWMDMFPYAKLRHLGCEWSDHTPIKLILNGRFEHARGRRPFRFEQVWVGEEGSEEAVSRGYEKGGGDIISTLEECANELMKWKGVNIGKVVRDIHRKRQQLDALNMGGRTVDQVNRRRKLVAEKAELRRQEELFWRQRLRLIG